VRGILHANRKRAVVTTTISWIFVAIIAVAVIGLAALCAAIYYGVSSLEMYDEMNSTADHVDD
jgi:flagellar basal body-associated protein FliL